MGPYSVSLRVTFTPASVVVLSYMLLIEATSAHNLSNKIFVYRRTTAGVDIFEGVATPEQLLTVPEDDPDEDSLYPTKFRINSVEQADADPTVLVEARTVIEAAVDRLTTSLTDAAAFSVEEDSVIGILGWAHSTNSLISV